MSPLWFIAIPLFLGALAYCLGMAAALGFRRIFKPQLVKIEIQLRHVAGNDDDGPGLPPGLRGYHG